MARDSRPEQVGSSIQPTEEYRHVVRTIVGGVPVALATLRCDAEGMTAMKSDSVIESLSEVRRWLEAVAALTDAVNAGRSLRDVLDLVAHSARQLLGFDFCGVLLPDPTARNLVITGASGLSAEYIAQVNANRPVRLSGDPAEQAPSGRAFNSGCPVAIDNIAVEPQFTPWGGVAREQGYLAMVSVPLLAGGKAVGTLNGYHAEAHDFTSLEIERLTLLASQAAIALTSARMVEEMQLLNRSLREQRDLLTKSEQIHEQLLEVALRGGGLDGIATTLSDLLARPVLIEDPQGSVLALTGSPGLLPGAEVRAETSWPSGGVELRMATAQASTGHYLAATVQLAGETVARVWMPGGEALATIDERAVEHASIVIALEIVRLRTGLEVEHRLRGELLADVLGGAAVSSSSVRERAERLGHDLSRPHVAFVARLSLADNSRAGPAYQRALGAVATLAGQTSPRPLAAMHRGAVVLLWPLPAGDPTTAPEVIGRAAAAVRLTLARTSGVSGALVAVSGTEHHDYPQAYRVARGALEVAVRAGRADAVVTLADLGISGLLLQLDDADQLLAFADRTLSPIREHDRQRGTQLVTTLRTYLDSDLNRSVTAARLHVHPNTVTQRLQRIEALTTLDLSSPATLVQIGAALLLIEIGEGAEPPERE